ncbi:MAG: putative fumarylacetoacetate hydrolase family [Actinomycetia bacterium]|nr:putative fumarylacetoacetate hydrolase family [Actinomycetes bacterium]
MQLVTTTDGIGRVGDGGVALLDVPWPDLGAVLAEHEGLEVLGSAPVRRRVDLDEVVLRAPVPRPGKVWAVGLNYRAHAAETGREPPTEPMVFIKVTSSVVAGRVAVRLPAAAPDKVDFEGEVAIVIGRRATSVAEADAWSHVAGITACNDVSARDVQRGTGNFGLAKSFDTFTPLGGSLVTVDEYDDPDDIGLTTLVDGEVRQHARTDDLVFPVPALIAYLSRHTTLEPGDVISTGTPAGVGEPDGRFLRPGSVVDIRVERVLPLVNDIR